MTQQVCPFLGTLDSNNRRGPHVEFPSFENHCLAGGTPELILLGDQATYCLSAACTSCPRYRASRQDQALGAGFVPFVNTAEDTWSAQTVSTPELALLDSALDDGDGGRARWGKLGAALIFVTVLLCGSLTAAYSGWQWVTRDLRPQTAAGRVDVTGNTVLDPEPTPAVYVVMTATPQQVVIAAPQQTPAASTGTDENGIIPVLPQAVTPTPIRIDPGAVDTGSSTGSEATGTGTPAAGPAAGDPSEGTPLVDVELLVPTRRPTPVFDVPTSTPLPDGSTPGDAVAPAATNTPVPTPAPLGTPIVLFAPKDKELMKGDCTMVQWNVQNVREVYYENLAENGQGEREECMRKAEDQVYSLLVVWGDGSPHTYTTTVAYLPPTPTVTVTPSFTPEPVFTPTWTPEPATPTPPPNMFYATNLSVNGSADILCAAGQTCDVGLLITNGGSGTDNVTVMVLSSDGFPVQLCRPDGVCGSGGIPINNIGASNTAYVNARFTIPADAASQARGTASFQARSDGSGGGITSGVVNISVTVP
jgi:hypothetical protein